MKLPQFLSRGEKGIQASPRQGGEESLPREWASISNEINNRYQLILGAVQRLKEIEAAGGDEWYEDLALKLAATDVFVEKAQARLTRRAKSLSRWGALVSFLTLAALGAAAWAVFRVTPKDLVGGMNLDGYLLTLIIVRALSFGGFVLTAVYFLGGLSRALFHESTVLYNRRHALRFGRLSIYLSEGDIDVENMQKIFQWNDEFTSAFKDIQADNLKSAGVGKALEVPPKILKELSSLVESLRKLKAQ